MTAYTWDGNNSRRYRRDCSGFVSMAWHLDADPNTVGLADGTYTVPIARGELRPGDLLNDTISSETGWPWHAILFGGWENDAKTRFWYYSFGATPVEKVTGASFSQATLSGHPTSEYRTYRYKNVIEDSSSEDRGLADVTGDGFTDLVATKSDGTMWLYSNNFLRDDGWPYSDVRQIGSGWTNYDRIVASDATGDGYADLVAWRPDGTMWLYSNNFNRDNGRPYSDVRQIGSGWNAFNRIIAADATGDGYTDLVAWKPDGTMWLYSNNFNRDNGHPYSDVRQIGSGWNGYNRIVASDATGDGYTDLVAWKSDGTMWLYSNNFNRDNGHPYSDVRQIGSGWNSFNRIVASDATGDGYTDLVAWKSDGTMWLYSNNFGRDNGHPYSDVRQIGSGWNAFNRVFA
ncbi:hypothetical protein Psuf_001630 [Phytohabitans suffuscus]|uniref:NlpC/P60 domain-containing protein n=1 Tax=Phytohabitans suffuscus TaxID=624315 RepID=A0A6F8Y9W7_9ACTN|nr:FG-GAP-like repeat-containing protein [Phytohabitans suffuscus]BCB82850.1 hypothetical protein Psuf_001630 [Phytohabitans suffuscus]